MKLLPPWAYAGIAAGIFVTGFGTGWMVNGWRSGSRYNELKAEGWEERAAREKAAREALERQVREHTKTAENNAEVIRDLETQYRDIDANRALLRRLLDKAARAATRGCPVSEASDRSEAPAAGGDEGDDRLARMAEAAISECQRNAARQDALIRELTPQL